MFVLHLRAYYGISEGKRNKDENEKDMRVLRPNTCEMRTGEGSNGEWDSGALRQFPLCFVVAYCLHLTPRFVRCLVSSSRIVAQGWENQYPKTKIRSGVVLPNCPRISHLLQVRFSFHLFPSLHLLSRMCCLFLTYSHCACLDLCVFHPPLKT